jgi:hypothetical protein
VVSCLGFALEEEVRHIDQAVDLAVAYVDSWEEVDDSVADSFAVEEACHPTAVLRIRQMAVLRIHQMGALAAFVDS